MTPAKAISIYMSTIDKCGPKSAIGHAGQSGSGDAKRSLDALEYALLSAADAKMVLDNMRDACGGDTEMWRVFIWDATTTKRGIKEFAKWHKREFGRSRRITQRKMDEHMAMIYVAWRTALKASFA